MSDTPKRVTPKVQINPDDYAELREIERLESELAAAKARIAELEKHLSATCSPESFNDLIKQRDALRPDAERYLWLKQKKIGYNGWAWHWIPGEPLWNADLDSAIDAAMASAAPASSPQS